MKWNWMSGASRSERLLVKMPTWPALAVSAAVSALCVLPPQWSKLDMVVSARLIAPLLAYRGKPSPVDMGATHVPVVKDLSGHEIMQLFIPGLGNGDVLRAALMWGPPVMIERDSVWA